MEKRSLNLTEVKNFLNSLSKRASETESLSSFEVEKELLPSSDVDLIEELLAYLYTSFKRGDNKQKSTIVKMLLNLLDLKWKYIGLEKKEAAIDTDKLKEALQKAGVVDDKAIIEDTYNPEEEEVIPDGQEEE